MSSAILRGDKQKSVVNNVHYIGSYLPTYARHRIIQQGFRDLGVAVKETIDRSLIPARWLRLIRALARTSSETPILVGEASNYLTPVLLEAHRLNKPLVFDPFVSLRDTVEDRESGWKKMIMAPIMRLIDRINNWSAGAVLFDTPQTKAYFVRELGLDPAKGHVVYVGAETNLFYPRVQVRNASPQVTVLFYGTFIPLQGIDVIVRAAAKVQQASHFIHFKIVGSGQTYTEIRALARRLHVQNISFAPEQVPYSKLPDLIANANICLGIFADRPKTNRVIPNKLFQCAAMGIPVITADTEAIRDAFFPGELILIPPGDHLALAERILSLADDLRDQQRFGFAGMQAVHSRYNPSIIAEQALRACEVVCGYRKHD